MSLSSASSDVDAVCTVVEVARAARPGSVASLASAVMPMIAFMGVRISWLMWARNSLLQRLAVSAASLARASCRYWSRAKPSSSADDEQAGRRADQEARLLVPRERHAEGEGLDGPTLPLRSIARTSKRCRPRASWRSGALPPVRNADHAPPSRRYEKSSRSASVYFQRSTPLKARLTLPSGGASAAFDLREDGARRVAVGGRIVEAEAAAGAGPDAAAAVLEHLERGVGGQAVGLAVGEPDAVADAVDARAGRDPDAAVARAHHAADGVERRAAGRSSGRARALGEDVAPAGQDAVRGRGASSA